MSTLVVRGGVLALLTSLGAAGCDATAPSEVGNDPVPPADIARGRSAFLASCSGCHASRDGFDLAFFGFPDSVIVRRAIKHVPIESARDIAAYIRSLPVQSKGQQYRLFQPANAAAQTDGEFWAATFGAPANTWPASLTVAKLRSLDPRAVMLPFALPSWASENEDDDWMPDVPLPPAILAAEGGAIGAALDAYYQSPSDETLLAVVNRFRRIVRPADGSDAPSAVCRGNPGFQFAATDCFEAMRWMSSLTAVHFARSGAQSPIPLDVVRLWWETGEAAVSFTLRVPERNRTVTRLTRTAGWLALGFSFAPLEFRDGGAYFSQFTQHAQFKHYAMFTELYRMVNDGPINASDSRDPESEIQRIRDGTLAVLRAPEALKYQTAMFVLDYLSSRLDAGETFHAWAREPIELNMRFGLETGLNEATPVNRTELAGIYAQKRAIFDAKLARAFQP